MFVTSDIADIAGKVDAILKSSADRLVYIRRFENNLISDLDCSNMVVAEKGYITIQYVVFRDKAGGENGK
jgi:hypothetical protein